MRKIVQIAVSQSDGEGNGLDVNIVALCDDGRVWCYTPTDGDGADWVLMPPVPQEEKPSVFREETPEEEEE